MIERELICFEGIRVNFSKQCNIVAEELCHRCNLGEVWYEQFIKDFTDCFDIRALRNTDFGFNRVVRLCNSDIPSDRHTFLSFCGEFAVEVPKSPSHRLIRGIMFNLVSEFECTVIRPEDT